MLDSAEEQTELGAVLNITGNQATCLLDLVTLVRLRREGTDSLAKATSIGCYVKIDVDGLWLLGSIREIKSERLEEDKVLACIDLIGEGPRGADGYLASFQLGVTLYPHVRDKVYLAGKRDLDRVFSPENQPHVEIGTVYPTSDVRASLLYDKMLSRHFAVLGATGSGKSTFVAMLLHKIMDQAPEGHIVMLDPHGEYAAAFASSGEIHNVDNLEIPYWFMNLEEHCEALIPENEDDRETAINVLAKCLFDARSRNELAAHSKGITADSPIPYLEGDLIDSLDEEMGKLEKQADLQTYMRLKLNILQLFSDPRYRFIFADRYWQKSMNGFLSEVFRIPTEGKPISIIDLSGAPSQIVKVIVALMSRIILDYAIWTPKNRRTAILLVCEEAQRYLPAVHQEAVLSAERQLERIAREGRKYGVSLGLITQRPSELSETALSQCGTVITMRLSNIHDQARIEATLPDAARGLVELVPALQTRECIICGEGARVPVRVRLDEVEPELRPASDDPIISRLWNDAAGNTDVIDETVRRWRGDR